MADKGLNCAQNIAFSKKNGDGYLFSKSVKVLPEKEKSGFCWSRVSRKSETKTNVSFTVTNPVWMNSHMMLYMKDAGPLSI